MIRLRSLLIILATASGSGAKARDSPIVRFTFGDSVHIEANALFDRSGLLEGYYARVVTPVCESDKCYIIELGITWDQVGRYVRYDTIPGKGLTKLDHIPFSDADYEKLHSILKNPSSALSYYTKDELVRNTRSSKIDGITGATIGEISKTVISGAVYSCHTLWNIVHGSGMDSLKSATASILSPGLVTKLTGLGDQVVNYFLINHFTDADFYTYLPEILETIRQGEGYYPKHAIEKMPDPLLGDLRTQEFFASSFMDMDYFTQVTLLEKLSTEALSKDLRNSLERSLTKRDSYRNDLIIELLEKYPK